MYYNFFIYYFNIKILLFFIKYKYLILFKKYSKTFVNKILIIIAKINCVEITTLYNNMWGITLIDKTVQSARVTDFLHGHLLGAQEIGSTKVCLNTRLSK